MTDSQDVPETARRALERHGAFELGEEGYDCTTTPFDATVTAAHVDAEGRDAEFVVRVSLPSLDAAVEGERVADVVAEGWFETLELRLEDAYDVAEVDSTAELTIDRRGDRIVACFRFVAWDADAGVANAKAIVDYVEGTYVQGVIPGYEYGEPVAGLLSRASEQASSDDAGARRGGTPL